MIGIQLVSPAWTIASSLCNATNQRSCLCSIPFWIFSRPYFFNRIKRIINIQNYQLCTLQKCEKRVMPLFGVFLHLKTPTIFSFRCQNIFQICPNVSSPWLEYSGAEICPNVSSPLIGVLRRRKTPEIGSFRRRKTPFRARDPLWIASLVSRMIFCPTTSIMMWTSWTSSLLPPCSPLQSFAGSEIMFLSPGSTPTGWGSSRGWMPG